MKIIKLKTQSAMYNENNFYVSEVEGKETLFFKANSQDLCYKSLYINLFDTNTNAIQPVRNENDTTAISYDRDFRCNDEFFIVTTKGAYGFDTLGFVSLCRVAENDTEFDISIDLVEDNCINNNLFEQQTQYFKRLSVFADYCCIKQNDGDNEDAESAFTAYKNTHFLDINGANTDILLPIRVYQNGELFDSHYYPHILQLNLKEKIKCGTKFANCQSGYAVIYVVDKLAHNFFGDMFAILKMATQEMLSENKQ